MSLQKQPIYAEIKPLSYRFYPSLGLAVWHRFGWDVGIRAGKNGFSHQHNDLGSLTLLSRGSPWLIDVGVETYTRKTFSDERYTIWTMRSPWHNTVNPKEGEQSKDSVAHLVSVSEKGMKMELSLGAWHWTRKMSIGGQITVEDACPADSVLTLMSREKPVVEGKTVRYPALGQIRFSSAIACTLEEIPVTDPKLGRAWSGSLYRLLVTGAPFAWTIEPKA